MTFPFVAYFDVWKTVLTLTWIKIQEYAHLQGNTMEFWLQEHPPVCLSCWPWETQSSWSWYPAGALLRNHRDELAGHQEKFQSLSSGRFPMGFHHNQAILVKNLHSEEVKNFQKKRFSLNFLTSFNVNYSCYRRRQIISVQDSVKHSLCCDLL